MQHLTVVVVVDSVPRDFVRVVPEVVQQVGVRQVDARVDDGHDDGGRACVHSRAAVHQSVSTAVQQSSSTAVWQCSRVAVQQYISDMFSSTGDSG